MSALAETARTVLDRCRAQGVMVATAESCTGGMIAAALTDLAGSSAVFERGFVTYSNDAKMEMLGVSAETLAAHGAVSRETALEMAAGALARSKAGIAVSVTGIAGPDGGSADKPVGLVWFGLARYGAQPRVEQRLFAPERGRAGIREDAALVALELIAAGLDAGG